MAKGKGKRSSGANETVADGGVSATDTQPTPNLPQLDEGAFAGLRQKIEQRLKDQNSGKGKGKNNKSKAPNEEKAITKKEKDTTPKKSGRNQESAQGKKRDRNGDVIAREEKKAGKNKQSKPEGPKQGGQDETLRQEILALGGTEEDLDLLAGVDSESEVEGGPSKSKTKGGDDDLRKELSKMLEAAGQVVPDDLADEEAEAEDQDEAEEDIEDEEDDEVEEHGEKSDAGSESYQESSDDEPIEQTPKNTKEAATKPKEPQLVVPKEYAKLVSDQLMLWTNHHANFERI